jgi:lipoate-protein ligase A
LFENLRFLEDREPRDPFLQMAVDEALLESSGVPVLRVYCWDRPNVSVGYFEKIEGARRRHPGHLLVRRWTGGGTVVHGADAPYSLIVPRGEPFAAVRPAESYRRIHGILATVLRSALPSVALAAADAPKISSACFENPVTDDLMWDGCKIAGAGQRRTRAGLLHQGSLQLGTAEFRQAREFANRLSAKASDIGLASHELARANVLADSRYRTAAWLELR